MQLSVKHQLAFLCMPKCASTAIEKVLNEYSEIKFNGHPSIKHINATNFNKLFRPFIQNNTKIKIETFCLIREPIDWVNSWYRYRQRNALKSPKNHQHRNHTGDISFTEFVTAYLSERPPPYANIRTQSDFILLPKGRVGVDKIFRMEDMQKVEAYLSEKLAKPVEIEKKNVSPKRAGTELPEALLEALRNHLASDYALYNKCA